ncbi:DUF4962 domain-containing protein [Paenibacillus senegalensis]|uniref:DUF4962 domain-containing protein n=1 Tax=Paenibacillus senegalensis TaxID=1465766 RepID=UPI000288ED95|nr:DUF4962 domain-containing protein [Paenibacillus senegalensis]
MNRLFEPQSGKLTVQYAPDEHTRLEENPPRFTWIPAKSEGDCYVLQISTSQHFEAAVTRTIEPLPYNFYTPDWVFPPGEYYWRYALAEQAEVEAETEAEGKGEGVVEGKEKAEEVKGGTEEKADGEAEGRGETRGEAKGVAEGRGETEGGAEGEGGAIGGADGTKGHAAISKGADIRDGSGAATLGGEANAGVEALAGQHTENTETAFGMDNRGALSGEDSRSAWSRVRKFCVPADLPHTPLPAREARFEHTSEAHPRLWLNEQELAAFRQEVANDPNAFGWQTFIDRSVRPWLTKPLIAEPVRYPNNQRVAHLWRKMYMDCQELLYAVRHLSIAGVVLEDASIIEQAKKWLLHAVSWDVAGTTSRDYNDEAAFRVAGAIAWGYDWLYPHLSIDERGAVRTCLLERTLQVAYHVIERSKIHRVPYDSHAVRSLSSVLVPACLAMLHEEPQAKEWLHYTVEYYAGLYTPWGGRDGGWAEGPMYWTTGMAFVTEALNLLKKQTRLDFYRRPFFQKTGDFPLYCFSPDTVRASFGDQSTLGDPVSLKTGFNIRQFAGVTGNGLYQWYYEQVREADVDPESKYYNYGWWDFRFDEMMYRHDYPQTAPIKPTADKIEPVKWFRDIGWVAMHSRMDDPSEHIMLLTKSSRYGSISHSHGDQNGFLLHAYGEPLAIESGYYIAFNSTMHTRWRRQTLSTNSLLIDGIGQYAGGDKSLCLDAYGVIEDAYSREGGGYVRGNATAAYKHTVPYVRKFVRELYFFSESYVVIVDQVDLEKPGQVQWLFHTLYPMKLKNDSFEVAGRRADMEGRFVYNSSGELALSQHNDFPGVDPAEIEGLPRQWHLSAATGLAASHRLVTLLVPMKKGDSKYVSCFLDDQDHGVQLYFTDEWGISRKVEVPKAY